MKRKNMIISVVTMMAVGLGVFGVSGLLGESKAADTDFGKTKEVKEIVLEKAKVQETQVHDLEVDFDYENGKKVYEVELDSAGYEYDYTVDAETKEVIHSQKEVDDDYVEKTEATKKEEAKKEETKKTESTVSAKENVNKDIGKEEALRIALANAGLAENQVAFLKVERDIDDGRVEYEVEFVAEQKEYEYEIDGMTGNILDYDIEIED